jgi:prepilin-type processing-associated H-X9-DG protein
VKFRPLDVPAQKGCISYGYSEAIVYPTEPWLQKPNNGGPIDRRSLSDFPAPSRTILLAENSWGWHDTWYDKNFTYAFQNLDYERHMYRSIFVFCDGHAAMLKMESTIKPHNLWTIKPGD